MEQEEENKTLTKLAITKQTLSMGQNLSYRQEHRTNSQLTKVSTCRGISGLSATSHDQKREGLSLLPADAFFPLMHHESPTL